MRRPVRERYYPEEELPMRRPARERYYPEEEPPMRRPAKEKYYSEEELPVRRPAKEKYYSEEEFQQTQQPSVSVNDLPEEEEPSTGAVEEQKTYTHLWILAIGLFGFGDTITSVMVFSKGGYEANPMMAQIVSMLGGSIGAFVAVKTAILVGLAFLSFKMFKKQGWVIPAILSAVGGYLVASNIMALLNLSL